MSCGPEWMIKGTSSGCGLPKMSQPVRLSVAISAIVLGMLQGHYGPRCRLCTDNVPSSIPITGRPMKQHCDRKRHRAVGKESGLTSYIERFNNTLRQRVSRLVRRTLSFSKKLDNHIGAIWNFIHHYNALIRSEPSSC